MATPRTFPLGSSVTTVKLPPVDAGEEYWLALVNVDDPSGTARVTVNGGANLLPMLPPELGSGRSRDSGSVHWLGAERFDGRRQVPALGSQREFTLYAVPQPGVVTATLRAVNTNLLLYVDNDTPPGALTDEDVADLATTFGDQIVPTTAAAFGSPSDVDGDERVMVLLTPRIAAGKYGYFMAADLGGGGNQADLFYALVPDPGAGRPYSTLRIGLLATLAHELQHLINYHYKGLVHRLGSEESWLNEGLSFCAEEVNGYQDSEGGSPENVAFYFASPERYTLLERTRNYQDGHVGASYLFVQYLADRFGRGLYRTLVQSAALGTWNVESATNETFDALTADWAAAMALTAHGLAQDPRHQITSLDLNGSYLNETVRLTGPRATVVSVASGAPSFGVELARGGLRYLRLTDIPAGGVSLRLAPSGGTRTSLVAWRTPARG